MTTPTFRLRRVAAALALCLAPLGAAAETFYIVVWETPEDMALRTRPEAAAPGGYWAQWMAYSAALEAAGVLRGGAPLSPATASHGPGAGAAPSGVFEIETADRAEAERLAALAPGVARGGGAALAPAFPAPGMDR